MKSNIPPAVLVKIFGFSLLLNFWVLHLLIIIVIKSLKKCIPRCKLILVTYSKGEGKMAFAIQIILCLEIMGRFTWKEFMAGPKHWPAEWEGCMLLLLTFGSQEWLCGVIKLVKGLWRCWQYPHVCWMFISRLHDHLSSQKWIVFFHRKTKTCLKVWVKISSFLYKTRFSLHDQMVSELSFFSHCILY